MTALEDRSSVQSGTMATSSALYTRDLAPTKREGRRWGAYNVFTLWANDVHSLGNYAFALGLFALGLNVWGILAAFALASVLLFLLLTLSGFMGHRTGVPFPVMGRIAFGVRGAKIPAAVRGLVAITWFGIQTYLASSVLSILLVALIPSLGRLDTNSLLGQSTLGWITFLALWALQVLIVSYGMRMIRRYMAFAAPTTLLTMCALAVWTFVRAGGSVSLDDGAPLTGGAMWLQVFQAAALWVVVYGTFVLNFCDFTRSARSRAAIVRGNIVGIPVNMLFFACIVAVLSGAQFTLDGRVITSPTDIVRTVPHMFLLVLASLALIALTVAVNLLANFVAPIYALVDLFPRRLDFRRAGLVSAALGLVITPWNLYDSPVVVNYFLGGLGALLGPLFGVIMADYWLLRKTRVNVPALYTEDPDADYHYRRGYNPRAVAAFLPSAAAAVTVALVPYFHALAGFSWFVGALLAALLHTAVADRSAPVRDLDGEAIAVAAE
ncbi:NCS1 family nucleobase:cation symporter-1 [Streptomyces sp. NPDC004042]|uniref:NCS1 family nucleobase:cation symporter-1 n=1 Tax=Streptomyces sp. NPDC004042 TaxID=3154451 RepID=UPI0033BBE1A9